MLENPRQDFYGSGVLLCFENRMGYVATASQVDTVGGEQVEVDARDANDL